MTGNHQSTISVACDYEESDDDNDDVDSPNGDQS